MARYDTIGRGYSSHRKADGRLLSRIEGLLDLRRGAVLADIGAGTGNYSNALATRGYKVFAVEPSEEMRRQAQANDRVRFVAGTAEAVPLKGGSVEGIVSTLAIQHFTSVSAAADEMHRICPSGPVVVFTNDPRKGEPFWFADYFPQIYQRLFVTYPTVEGVAGLLASAGGWKTSVHPFPLPSDFSDWNMRSGWNRPEIYLDPKARQSMSGFALAPESAVAPGIERLRLDLESGRWDGKYGHLRKRDCLDLGFVLLKFSA